MKQSLVFSSATTWITSMVAKARGGPTARKQVTRQRKRLVRRLTPYLFLMPFLVLFLVFFLIPLVNAFILSLYRERDGLTQFVGFANFQLVLQDAVFFEGVKRLLLYGVVQVPVMIGLALLFALLLDTQFVKGKRFFRLVFFLPYTIPGVVGALIWGYLYSPQLSIISQAALSVGLPAPTFFAPSWLLWSLANIAVWAYTGYNMVVIYTALQAIPPELYEAARIDGASEVTCAWYVKIPSVGPALILTLVFSIIGALQLFQEPLILSSLTTISANYTPNLYAYNFAFSYGNFNYSAALAFMLALVTFIFSFVFLRIVQRG